MKWTNRISHNDEVHTMPVDDLIEHEPEHCVCIPKDVPVKREDGSVGWQVIHNALRPEDEMKKEAEMQAKWERDKKIIFIILLQIIYWVGVYYFFVADRTT